MILKIHHIKANFEKFNPVSISWLLAFCGAVVYPHTAEAGAAYVDGKTVITTIMCAAFVMYTLSRQASGLPVFLKNPITRPIVFLTLLVVISGLFAQNQPIALEALMLFGSYVFCFFIFLSFSTNQSRQMFLVYALLALALGLSIYGIDQYFMLNRNPNLKSVWRLHSTFGNSNQMAGFLTLMIPLCTGVLLTCKKSKIFSLVAVANLILILALFFTYARGGWISTFVGTLFVITGFAANQSKNAFKILSITCAACLLLSVIFVSSTDLVNRFNTLTQQDVGTSAYGRLLAWEGTIDMIKANPLTGVGPGNYATAFTQFQPAGLTQPYKFAHNDYLHFISETGIKGKISIKSKSRNRIGCHGQHHGYFNVQLW